MFIDLNKIVNENIENAYNKGRMAMARQIQELMSQKRYDNQHDIDMKIIDIVHDCLSRKDIINNEM